MNKKRPNIVHFTPRSAIFQIDQDLRRFRKAESAFPLGHKLRKVRKAFFKRSDIRHADRERNMCKHRFIIRRITEKDYLTFGSGQVQFLPKKKLRHSDLSVVSEPDIDMNRTDFSNRAVGMGDRRDLFGGGQAKVHVLIEVDRKVADPVGLIL